MSLSVQSVLFGLALPLAHTTSANATLINVDAGGLSLGRCTCTREANKQSSARLHLEVLVKDTPKHRSVDAAADRRDLTAIDAPRAE
ncbi:hypothetical protein EJ03DRAFT_58644 [Teratosphaeria nubilosa]|uniref:Uncharacterized protein n=1 Tax=Teratosphaeria nubilosa TaxID=161662 RepID=A0A6G1KTP1_9PEZI|nr:hypothetical protein EJ03DRAFT_58644 [Teratosphaeria nubilosa]